MKRLRLYAVVDVEDDVRVEDLPIDVANVLDGIIGEPQFVAARADYAGEFAEMGADPSGWPAVPARPSHDALTCDQSPCDLCKRRSELEGIFVHGKCSDGLERTLCSSCLATHPEIDLASDDTPVWEVGSNGWTGIPICDDCKQELDVEMGDEPEGTP